MDQLIGILTKAVEFKEELISIQDEFLQRTNEILYGEEAKKLEPLKDSTNMSPHQKKKKPKRLSILNEDDERNASPITAISKNSIHHTYKEEGEKGAASKTKEASQRNKKSDENTAPKNSDDPQSASKLMPPPPVAAAAPAVSSASCDQSFSRPQRAAKLICEKNLKEPALNTKLRRPSNCENTSIMVKVERESGAREMNESAPAQKLSDSSTNNTLRDSVVVVVPPKENVVVTIDSDDEETSTNAVPQSTANVEEPNTLNTSTRTLRVRIKRENLSITKENRPESKNTAIEAQTQAKEDETTTVESSITSSNTTQSKKGRKKKNKVFPKPIKVERLSKASEHTSIESVASRTRQKDKSLDKEKEPLAEEQSLRKDMHDGPSIYEEAVENLQTSKNDATSTQTESNHTVILGTAPNDATYCTASTATFILDNQNAKAAQQEGTDLTFNVANEKAATESQHSSMQSMETARDTRHPDSLLTEDESFDGPEPPAPKNENAPPTQAPSTLRFPVKPKVKSISSENKITMPNRTCKMPTRTIEIANPLVDSPVKKKIAAYENAAAAQAASLETLRLRSKQTPSNARTSKKGSATAKQPTSASAVGRFATSSQCLNVTPNVKAQSRNVATSSSVSKIQPLRRSKSSSNIKQTASSAKALPRVKSIEDFRKGLNQLAEDRKKQREQKHLLAAQQREAIERERAERLAKLTKEREERRLKKQQETEQKKRELEEIQRKLREQEEAAAVEIAKHKAKVIEQEKTMLQLLKPNPGSSKAKARMPPPKPKTQVKYTFQMLHEYDSTDDEDKVTYKRPPPPEWSRRDKRAAFIVEQQVMPAAVVDSFFSSGAFTPDLKAIFPGINPRFLHRNSSAIWSTPPRYSELPKY